MAAGQETSSEGEIRTKSNQRESHTLRRAADTGGVDVSRPVTSGDG
jgi:hypothetical protein